MCEEACLLILTWVWVLCCESSFKLKFTRKKANRNDQETTKHARILFDSIQLIRQKNIGFHFGVLDTLLLLFAFWSAKERNGKGNWLYGSNEEKKEGRKWCFYYVYVVLLLIFCSFGLSFPFFLYFQVAICRHLLVV